jgi:hypothetical protein
MINEEQKDHTKKHVGAGDLEEKKFEPNGHLDSKIIREKKN